MISYILKLFITAIKKTLFYLSANGLFRKRSGRRSLQLFYLFSMPE